MPRYAVCKQYANRKSTHSISVSEGQPSNHTAYTWIIFIDTESHNHVYWLSQKHSNIPDSHKKQDLQLHITLMWLEVPQATLTCVFPYVCTHIDVHISNAEGWQSRPSLIPLPGLHMLNSRAPPELRSFCTKGLASMVGVKSTGRLRSQWMGLTKLYGIRLSFLSSSLSESKSEQRTRYLSSGFLSINIWRKKRRHTWNDMISHTGPPSLLLGLPLL